MIEYKSPKTVNVSEGDNLQLPRRETIDLPIDKNGEPIHPNDIVRIRDVDEYVRVSSMQYKGFDTWIISFSNGSFFEYPHSHSGIEVIKMELEQEDYKKMLNVLEIKIVY